ncbi:uncharacterized protein [Choristoneura fumiferana]|uniref:uncharacterized protein n=1 Tax=Choristoneura fumiferana TaxID=7141 RepID=UPI003D15665C
MRFTVIAVFCACVCLATGDLHAKSKLVGRLAGKLKHHKRGVFSPAPPYKYGHDIPHVTHSIVKPIVVSYPPTASVTAVKVPLQHPLIHRYPVGVGHKVPVPHPHYGLKFPHHKFALKPDQHFHHHHHHVAPRPVLPILPAHAVPAVPAVPSIPTLIPQPSVSVAQPVPAPPPVTPILPASPQFILPQSHVHLKPVLPAPIPIQPAPVTAPLYPYAPQFSYAIRPGNAVQTSYFATYPRYPLLNYHQSVVPLAPSVAPAPGPVFLERPQPHLHVLPDHTHGVVEQPTPAVAVEQTFLHPTQAAIPQHTLHLQPAQPAVHVDHNGWAPVPHGHDLSPQEHHFNQHDLVPTQETHYAPHDHFTQEQGHQVYEHHTGEEQYHEYQHQLQHHIQQQIEQAQYEQNLNHHQHQLGQEYGQPNVDYHQQNQDFAHAHDFSQQAHEQAQQEYAQQEFAHHQQQDFNQQPGQEYGQPQQEYGAAQQHVLEGRSEEGEEPQRFHNHIPLGLQLPLDRPLDHFR